MFSDIHQSAIALKPLTVEMNSIDNLITAEPVGYYAECKQSGLEVVLEEGKIGKCKNLGDFDKAQIVMTG